MSSKFVETMVEQLKKIKYIFDIQKKYKPIDFRIYYWYKDTDGKIKQDWIKKTAIEEFCVWTKPPVPNSQIDPAKIREYWTEYKNIDDNFLTQLAEKYINDIYTENFDKVLQDRPAELEIYIFGNDWFEKSIYPTGIKVNKIKGKVK